MRAVLQRVESASVHVADEVVGAIGRGVLILLGVERGDGPAEVAVLAEKVGGLRLFEDSAGRMNLAIEEVGGSFLVVSQFTLAGNLRKGRRPSFDDAAPPGEAAPLVELFVAALRRQGRPVETGRFQAMMKVHLVNDGPLTFVLEARHGKIV